MGRPILLDVDVALFDSAHVHHTVAHQWFASNLNEEWRTCPLTENAFLRILSHPSYPNGPVPILDLAKRLEEFKSTSSLHGFGRTIFLVQMAEHSTTNRSRNASYRRLSA
jgi:predicted nucleic acid-binding protein